MSIKKKKRKGWGKNIRKVTILKFLLVVYTHSVVFCFSPALHLEYDTTGIWLGFSCYLSEHTADCHNLKLYESGAVLTDWQLK